MTSDDSRRVVWPRDHPDNPWRQAPIGDEGVEAWPLHRVLTWPPDADICLCAACQTRRTQQRAADVEAEEEAEA